MHESILASAGTLSPASNWIISPGTSSSARMLTGAPPLTALHLRVRRKRAEEIRNQ